MSKYNPKSEIEGPTKGYYWQGLDTLKVPMSLHKENREKLVHRLQKVPSLPANSFVVLEGGKLISKYDTDESYLFRQESFFQYCFGVDQHADFYGCIEVSTGKATLFIPNLPEDYAVWMGEIFPPEYYKEMYQVDDARFVEDLGTFFDPHATLLLLKGINSDSDLEVKPAHFAGIEKFHSNVDILYHEICECRAIKTEKEVEVLRYVAQVSSEAHKKVMLEVRPGMKEYQAESIFLNHCYLKGGCRYMAYTCICGSGHNGSILHYGHAGAPNDKTFHEGDMVLFDMGAAYHGYCSDITVSFPVSGKFTEDQKIVYEAVLDAQESVKHAMKPGVSWPDMHRLAERKILEHFLKAGILHNGSISDLEAAYIGFVFMPHGLGHLLGLDTHDVAGYPKDGPKRVDEPGVRKLRTARVLEEGMYITVEPGCYFIDILLDKALKDPVQSKYFNVPVLNRFRGFGGVRLEDDVLVTKNGGETLSNVPRTVKEIEEFLAQRKH
eukprot:TRINITY_DN381_c0_g1_i1.p1 TRINITY_DN381_c0_g1~~TRINITY_DN381_c0_g1_i1.p1  ORF type:complete len:495 (+),score=92.82 TRINITY_DN381_c0_g1_i1:845-2329(+)